jgi:3-hydroxyethyl bacteriochlorophyllide a dehydrogenase
MRTCPAVVFTGPGEVEVREAQLPELRPQDVLVRTEASIISNGTETWVWSGRFHSPGKAPAMSFPWIPGYQRVGIIEEVGAEVQGLEPGMRVTCTISRWEGEMGRSWGSHAAWGVTAADQCLRVPEGLAPQDVAGLVLTQVGFNGGTRPPVEPGWGAVVIGDGLVGQWAAQTFRARGAHVVLCGRHPLRLEIAARVSADEVVNDREQDIQAFVKERWPNGVDIADEAVGRIANVELAFSLLRRDGHLVFNGYHPEGEHLMNIQWMHDKEITCHGMAGWTRPRLEGTLQWLAEGKLNVRDLITHRFKGADAAQAYRMLWDRSEEFLGLLLEWDRS